MDLKTTLLKVEKEIEEALVDYGEPGCAVFEDTIELLDAMSAIRLCLHECIIDLAAVTSYREWVDGRRSRLTAEMAGHDGTEHVARAAQEARLR